MKGTKKIWVAGILLGLALIVYFPGKKLAREHVDERTAVTDHPLNCASCHLYITKNEFISSLVNETYLSPLHLEVAPDGRYIYAVAQDADMLLKVDAERSEVVARIPVGDHPHSVLLNEDGSLAFVSNQWSDNVSVIETESAMVIDTIPTGNGPAGLALSGDGKHLYTVNTFGSNLSVIELASERELKRLPTGSDPTGIAMGPEHQLMVTARRAIIAPYGEEIRTDLTLIDDLEKRAEEKIGLKGAYMMENVTYTPGGDLALVTLIRPKNNVPSVQVEGGWMMTHGFAVIEQGEGGRTAQFLLDEPNAYYPDPFDIAVSKDGKRAYISSAGVNKISVIALDSVRMLLQESSEAELAALSNQVGLSSRLVIGRIATGAAPKGLALAPDGKLLYVAEQLEDQIAVIDTRSLKKVGSIDLGGPDRITVARRGRRLFANAGHTFQNQYSCYTCHPDNHEDGLVYNMAAKYMGRNLANTQSLREIGDTAPFKWNGKNQTVYKQDGMRFSTVLTRTEQFSYPDLDAITAYIMRGIPQPPNLLYGGPGGLSESQQRGKEIFEREKDNFGEEIPENNRCVTCHPAPWYSNFQMADVSTLAETDDPMLFDTPHLSNVFASPPYLHDGRAHTLEEIWTVYGEDDRHGRVNDLTKTQLNDLINYLKSLESPKHKSSGDNTQYGSFFHLKYNTQ